MSEVHTSALLSPDRRYRYYLHRVWDSYEARMVWIMLNPSTADEHANDATIRVCMGRASLMGYGGIAVVNLFALRSTDPQGLYDLFANPVSDPAAPNYNDEVIRQVVTANPQDLVVCAWGKHGAHLERGRIIRDKLHEWGVVPKALRFNKDGTPAHPLRIPYDVQPVNY